MSNVEWKDVSHAKLIELHRLAQEEIKRLRNTVENVDTPYILDIQGRLSRSEAKRIELWNTLQSITEDGTEDCEWCKTHELMAQRALAADSEDV